MPFLAKGADTYKLELGWLAVSVPLATVALLAIRAGLTAERHTLKAHASEIEMVRDAVAQSVRRRVAALAAEAYPAAGMSTRGLTIPAGQPGNPENEIARVLAITPGFFLFVDGLELDMQRYIAAGHLHRRLVGHYRRRAIAATVFLLPLTYISFVLGMPNFTFPAVLTPCAIAIGIGVGAWALTEYLVAAWRLNKLSRWSREEEKS